MQINRLFEMIYLLLERGQMTAKELAERFEVSERTIHRDIEVLSSAGIPVYASKGRGGGIGLLDHFVLDKSVLSEREKNEILFALQGMSVAQYPEINATLGRLSSLFQQGNTTWIDADFTQWGSGEEEKRKFGQLRDAILGRKKVVFAYCSAYGERTTREVLPVKLQFKGKAWYLQGFCLKRAAYRTFKILRMSDLTVTQEQFDPLGPPPPFEPGEQVQKLHLIQVKLRFSPSIFYRVYEEFDANLIARDADGSLLVEAAFPMDEWVYGYLLSFGGEVEVLGPAFVRDILIRKIRQAAEVYEKI